MISLIHALILKINKLPMSDVRLLLCTDLDRTVIPNGEQEEFIFARDWFARFCNLPEVTLVYVTGRHKELVDEAIDDYELPTPNYAITDVGSKIYSINESVWNELSTWESEVDTAWNFKSHAQLQALFADMTALTLQELSKQNTHKLSYYLSMIAKPDDIMTEMRTRLDKQGVDANLIYSTDEAKDVGLLDVLPANASKLHAIEFLQQQLDYSEEEVVFAGDSGNDLDVLTSPICSVLVANATNEVKQSAIEQAQTKGNVQSLFIASGNNINMNGNYSAGILEGVWHFVPALHKQLTSIGVRYE